MSKTIFGIFDGRHEAERAITNLEDKGFNPKDISIIVKDTKEAEEMSESTGANVSKGAASGATTGAVLGGLTGLLVGLGAIAIPGIGAILIGGPLAAALGLTGAAATTFSGAATGALAGGLVGALVGLGVPEREAKVYEERVREGAVLLAVPADDAEEIRVRDVLEQAGATNISSVVAKTH